MAETMTLNELLAGHVGLDIECLDRIYLNGYVPNLQVAGPVFVHDRAPGLSDLLPAIMEKIGTAFRRRVKEFAHVHQIPVVKFDKHDRETGRDASLPLAACMSRWRTPRSELTLTRRWAPKTKT